MLFSIIIKNFNQQKKLNSIYLRFLKKQKTMSLDTQKLDSNQRQQIMASVQQQLALQNAQELLQVKFQKKISSYLNLYFRNYLINVLKLVFKNQEVLYQVPNRFDDLLFSTFIVLYAQKCITQCSDRYMDAWNIVSRAYADRIKREQNRR